MTLYYVTLQTKSQAFLLERRMKQLGINCSLVFVPREIMNDLCSMGVSFKEEEYPEAVNVVKNSGLPGCRLFKATVLNNNTLFTEIVLD